MAQVYKNAGIEVAQQVGDSDALDDAAGVVLDAAKVEAAKHRDTGHYIQSLGVAKVAGPRGVTDRVVYSDDPAALSIEFGHLTRKGGTGKRSWVPGKFILINAARKAGH